MRDRTIRRSNIDYALSFSALPRSRLTIPALVLQYSSVNWLTMSISSAEIKPVSGRVESVCIRVIRGNLLTCLPAKKSLTRLTPTVVASRRADSASAEATAWQAATTRKRCCIIPLSSTPSSELFCHACFASASIVFHSSGLSCIFRAAIFSSRCASDDVPGIGSITGDRCNSHASPS